MYICLSVIISNLNATSQLFDYELDPTQVWQVWPADQSVTTFLTQSAPILIPVIIEGFITDLAQTLIELQANMETLQQQFVSNMTALQASLQAFIASTQIDDNFAR